MASSLQPKERVPSTAFLSMAAQVCTSVSYRKAAGLLNLFLHRDGRDSVKLRTLSDLMERTGGMIADSLSEAAGRVLGMHGFDRESGQPTEGTMLSGNIMGPEAQGRETADIQRALDQLNACREEKIPFRAEELGCKVEAPGCVYVSVDDIGVKHQKDSRAPGYEKRTKNVENTVAHVQYGEESYTLTAIGMKAAMKEVLAFLLFNGLLQYRLVFLTDGAKNIKSSIEGLFSFRPYSIILDWFHLKKKCQELLSMAIKGKDARNSVLGKLLRILWGGDVDGATRYLRSLPPSMVKSPGQLEEQCLYLERKREYITCYAVRASLGLRNSSNPVEKENDLLVAQRQKHNGMSWSEAGSGSLAAIEMVFQNGYEDLWFQHGQISFEMPSKKEVLDKCA